MPEPHWRNTWILPWDSSWSCQVLCSRNLVHSNFSKKDLRFLLNDKLKVPVCILPRRSLLKTHRVRLYINPWNKAGQADKAPLSIRPFIWEQICRVAKRSIAAVFIWVSLTYYRTVLQGGVFSLFYSWEMRDSQWTSKMSIAYHMYPESGSMPSLTSNCKSYPLFKVAIATRRLNRSREGTLMSPVPPKRSS